MEESYVSLEIAKLLKEKGFNEFCRAYWGGFNTRPLSLCGCNRGKAFDYCWNTMLEKDYSNNEQTYIAAPTLQMTCRWLREKHGIHIEALCPVVDIDTNTNGVKYNVVISNLNNYCLAYDTPIEDNEYDSYEEAIKAAIKYCLTNLIK